MCSLAFFAFLRIGELTMTTSNNQPLQMYQVSHICDTNNQITGIKLTFENFKHNYNQQPFSLEIYRQSMICPVQLSSDYLVLRGSRPGAIFISHLSNRVTQLLLNFRGLSGIVVWTLQGGGGGLSSECCILWVI
jgi:hypothetical protein